MARFFQYIDKNDESKWNSITELAYIDDRDPEMIMFHFTDGSKCNKDFVGPLNETDIMNKYVMVEVENKSNIWKIEKKVLDYKEKTATTANGETVTVPDLYMTDVNGNFKDPGTRYNYTPPKHSDKPIISNSNYYLSVINDKLLNNEYVHSEIIKNIPKHLLKTTELNDNEKHNIIKEKIQSDNIDIINEKNKDEQTSIQVLSEDKDMPSYLAINPEDAIITNTNSYVISSENYEYEFSDVINNKSCQYFKHLKIKNVSNEKLIYDGNADDIVNFINNQLSIRSTDDTNYDVIRQLEQTKYQLVSNMIHAAAKDDCDVDLTMGLKLPPVEVYNVLKKVYGDEYANMFVLNLAYNLPDEQIRQAIAAGLSAYYNPEENINEDSADFRDVN